MSTLETVEAPSGTTVDISNGAHEPQHEIYTEAINDLRPPGHPWGPRLKHDRARVGFLVVSGHCGL